MKIILSYQLFVNIFILKTKGKKKHRNFNQIKAISLVSITRINAVCLITMSGLKQK
jgi:hypothetical protein